MGCKCGNCKGKVKRGFKVVKDECRKHPDIEIKLPKTLETTALGAAYLAGLKVGFWNNLEEIVNLKQYQELFEPQFSEEDITRRYNGWKKAVEATRVFKREND